MPIGCHGFQRQRLINTSETRVNRITNGDSDSAARAPERRGLENGLGGAERGLNGRGRAQGAEPAKEAENENEDNDNNANDEEGDGEEGHDGPLVPFRIPGRFLFIQPLFNQISKSKYTLLSHSWEICLVKMQNI